MSRPAIAVMTCTDGTVKEPARRVCGIWCGCRSGPRALAPRYRWFRIWPRRIQCRREVNELPDGVRDGRW